MAKKGFYYNQTLCIGCRACEMSCKDKNDLPRGVAFRHVRSFETGEYPLVGVYHYAATCNHCQSPACVAACPVGAMHIDEDDGTVQHDAGKCIKCKYCVEACPYGVPQYSEEFGGVRKCNACIELRKNGERPACVSSCVMRVLEFGDVEELRVAHPDAIDKIAALPSPSKTSPSTLIDPKAIALEAEYEELYL